jgi:ubiquitin-activating enzyme E1
MVTLKILLRKGINIYYNFSIPLCTLKNFPYQIEHTIQWARDYFEGIFAEGPSEASKFYEQPK